MARRIDKKDYVDIICYNKRQTMPRKEAIEFYLDCMRNSEGSEQERYVKIYLELIDGKKLCTDQY